MQEKDAVSNVFFKDPARVADLLNGYIYHGQQVVKAENVQNLGERVYRVKGKYGKVKAEELTLDVVSEVIQRMQVSIVCLQNQSDVHYAMPVRVMNEEAARYHEEWMALSEQCKDKAKSGAEYISGFTKKDKLTPVITIVIYWGKEHMICVKQLKEFMRMASVKVSARSSNWDTARDGAKDGVKDVRKDAYWGNAKEVRRCCC